MMPDLAVAVTCNNVPAFMSTLRLVVHARERRLERRLEPTEIKQLAKRLMERPLDGYSSRAPSRVAVPDELRGLVDELYGPLVGPRGNQKISELRLWIGWVSGIVAGRYTDRHPEVVLWESLREGTYLSPVAIAA